MRIRRQARILERVVAVHSLEELLATREAEWSAICQVLAGVIRGRSATTCAVTRAARLRGVSEDYVADRVAVLATSLSDIRRHDPYAILGVSPAASAQAIQRRWREVVKTCHPDVAGEPSAAETFQRLRLAYETLRDPGRRVLWDARQLEHGGVSAQRAAAVFVEALECDRVGWWERAPVRHAAKTVARSVARCWRFGATLAAGAGRATGRGFMAGCRGLAAGGRGLAGGCRSLTGVVPVLGTWAVTAARHGWQSVRAAARSARDGGCRSGAAVRARGVLVRSGVAGALSAGWRAAATSVVVAAGRDAAARGAWAVARSSRAVVGLGVPLGRMAAWCRGLGAWPLRAGRATGYAVVRVAIAAGRLPGRALGRVAAGTRTAVGSIAALSRGVAIGCRRVPRHAAAIGTVAAAVTALLAITGVSGDRLPGGWHGYDRLVRRDAGQSSAPTAGPSLMLATARPTAAEPMSVEPRVSLERPSEPAAASLKTPSSRPRPTAARGARMSDAAGNDAAHGDLRPRPAAVPSPVAPRVVRSEAASGATVRTERSEAASPAAVRVARSEAASPVAVGIERSQAAALLSTFRRRYEQRDVGGLVGLFAEDGVEDWRTGRESIAAAYESALRPWQQITYRLGGLSYEDRADSMRVTSPFVITYGRRDGAQIVRGTAAWDLVRRDGDLRIARLSYRIER